jgi:hypothetical protein
MPLAQSVAQDDNGEFVSFVPAPARLLLTFWKRV